MNNTRLNTVNTKHLSKKVQLTILGCLISLLVFAQQVPSTNNTADSARVLVSITVDTDGSVLDVKVKKITCKKCSKAFKESLKTESIRTVKAMPPFKAMPQRVRYLLPLKFKFDE